MIRGLFRLIFRLITLAVLIVLGTMVWIVYDGLNDHGSHADVAVVLGNAVRSDGVPGAVLRDRLDKAIELYRANEFPRIIVSGATKIGGYDEPAAMSNYLVEHQIPITVIIQDKAGVNTGDTGVDVERIMKARHFHSVMIVTNYYHVTRTKLALQHAGVDDIQQAHVGVVNQKDAYMLAREVLALYDYLFKFYVLPAVQKSREEARIDGAKIEDSAKADSDKIQQDADRERQRVRDDIDNLHK